MNTKHLCLIIITVLFSEALFSQANRTERNHLIFSKHLNESRVIDISLPLNYELTKKNYAVLYLLDGEYIFGYAKGTVDFLSNPFGYLPNMILVSIPNTDRNKDLFVSLRPEDGYVSFLSFLEQELKPFIDNNYRTNGFNMLYGWSSGSAVCSYLFVNKPELFDGYIQSGTSIGNKFVEMFTKKVPLNDYTNKYLYANTEGIKYLNTYGEGQRVKGLKRYLKLIDELKPKGLRWKFEVAEKETHIGVLAKGLLDGLKFIYSDFYLPDSITKKGASEIISYFSSINKNYSFNVEIPVGALNESAFILLQEKKGDEAVKLLLHGLELHPKSSDLLGTIGEIYEYKGDAKLAAKYYKLAFEKAKNDLKTHLKYKTLHVKLQATDNE